MCEREREEKLVMEEIQKQAYENYRQARNEYTRIRKKSLDEPWKDTVEESKDQPKFLQIHK